MLRWLPLVIPLLGLTLYLAVSLTSEIDPEYTSEVAVLLTGPSETLVTNPETGDLEIEELNPLTALGGSLSTVADVTSIAMGDGDIYRIMADEGLSTDFEVGVQSRSPIVFAVATHNDPDVAAATTDRLVELIADDLATRQDAVGAPQTDRIVSRAIADSTVGAADYGGRNRVRIAFAAIGLAATVIVAFLIEALFQLYRRYRRRGQSGPEPISQTPPPPDAESSPNVVPVQADEVPSVADVDHVPSSSNGVATDHGAEKAETEMENEVDEDAKADEQRRTELTRLFDELPDGEVLTSNGSAASDDADGDSDDETAPVDVEDGEAEGGDETGDGTGSEESNDVPLGFVLVDVEPESATSAGSGENVDGLLKTIDIPIEEIGLHGPLNSKD